MPVESKLSIQKVYVYIMDTVSNKTTTTRKNVFQETRHSKTLKPHFTQNLKLRK